MTAKPRKPLLVKWVWAAVLGAACLPVYVGSCGFWYWLDGKDAVADETTYLINRSVFAPVVKWSESKRSGALPTHVLLEWCYWHGTGNPVSWDEIEYDARLERGLPVSSSRRFKPSRSFR